MIYLILIIFSAIVNFIGVLGPELSFDALWYHLTLPKLYLINHNINFIPGGLLYYSVMPRLGEMFYTLALFLSDERLAKFIHFSFGLLAAFFTYKIARTLLPKKESLMASLIFYSTLIVGWLSTSAYIDLQRTAFEAGAFLFFIYWSKDKKLIKLILSAALLGLAVSTKSLAVGSIVIFIILILITKSSKKLLNVICYLLFALLPVLPWLFMAFKATGNPIYPIGSSILDSSHQITNFSLSSFFLDFWNLFLKPQDPISPIFLMILPIGLWQVIRSSKRKIKESSIFSFLIYIILSYIIWFFIPRTGGGRFILPYLPVWSVLTTLIIYKSNPVLKKILIIFVLLISIVHIGYRFMANKKYLPLILGKEIKDQFLCRNLNFSTNVFYDCDSYFKKNIKETVLIYCSHNLFYVDFPFIHESWLKPTDKYRYIMTQNCSLPKKYGKLPVIYKNKLTGVELYKVK